MAVRNSAGRRRLIVGADSLPPMSLPYQTPLHPGRCLLIALAGLVPLRHARAEDTVSYKYQDYQEADGRIGVQVHSALIEKSIGETMNLKVTGIMDTIAGATPTGEPATTPGGQVPLSQLEEKRKGWTADFSKQIKHFKITFGAANSRESDYVSHGWSVNGQAEFNQKQTVVSLGVGSSGDDVRVFYQLPWERKEVLDFIVGLSQVVDARTLVSFNLTYSESWGYLSDPYKLVEKRVEVVPGVFLRRTYSENRPDSRVKWIALAAINRAYPDQNGALDASYRFHTDDYGITTSTVNLEWYQKIGEKFVLRPSVRALWQTAADFYHVTLSGTTITPTAVPTGKGPHYSSDYRLSALNTLTYGLKGVWLVNSDWKIDAAVEKYDMHGRDDVTSDSAYPDALIFTVGASWTF